MVVINRGKVFLYFFVFIIAFHCKRWWYCFRLFHIFAIAASSPWQYFFSNFFFNICHGITLVNNPGLFFLMFPYICQSNHSNKLWYFLFIIFFVCLPWFFCDKIPRFCFLFFYFLILIWILPQARDKKPFLMEICHGLPWLRFYHDRPGPSQW